MRPEVTGIGWVDWLLVAAAVVGAIGVLWRKVVAPVVHAAFMFEQVLPVLLEIGHQFRPNDGATLRDSINRIEEKQGEQGSKLDTLHVYAHDNRHEQANQITKLALEYDVIVSKIEHLSAQIEPMPGQLDSIAVNAAANAAARVVAPPAATDE